MDRNDDTTGPPTITDLEPRPLWRRFHDLTRIPRPSRQEQAIHDWLLAFGRGLGLETIADEAGNVLIRKPASPGREGDPGVVLQGHMDMVAQANADTPHDFARDPIDAVVDGDWVRARGTTLGADNGIGVAAMLALLEAEDLSHGPLEALFTATEESGMDGAFGLAPDLLRGRYLINTDSEDEGVLTIGCAGGANVDSHIRYAPEPLAGTWEGARLAVTGLRGGHSGVDIHRGRGNAVALLFRVLANGAARRDLRIQSLDAGSLRNAIPREAFADLALPAGELAAFTALAAELEQTLRAELEAADPELRIRVTPQPAGGHWLGQSLQERLIDAVRTCPHGVLRMSDAVPGLVESSSNLAIVRTGEGVVEIRNLVRSSLESARDDICDRLAGLFRLAGAENSINGHYPGWRPDPDSGLLRQVRAAYRELFGRDPEVGAMHAGLECGVIGARYPAMEMISFGPTIRFPHSPDERVEIATVTRFWELLTGVLARLGR